MRRSFRSQILKDENGQVVGIDLGSDYCAEHEHGISGLKSFLGVKDSPSVFGIDSRRVSELQMNNIILLDNPVIKSPVPSVTAKRQIKKKCTVLLIGDFYKEVNSVGSLPGEVKPYSAKGTKAALTCAWDSKSLAIYAETDEDRDAVKKVYKALIEKDLAIWLGGSGPFQNAGLVLGIISAVPESSKKVMFDADEDDFNLKQEVAKIGIEQELKSAGLGWYALSPKWSSELKSTGNGKVKTSYPIVFWLNPTQQKQFNYGWFTVENLKDWIVGKGPIPIQQEAKG